MSLRWRGIWRSGLGRGRDEHGMGSLVVQRVLHVECTTSRSAILSHILVAADTD